MANLRATVCLSKLSGKPEDEVCNVWHFATGGAIITADMDAVGLGLEGFYQQLAVILGKSVSRAALAHRIEFAEVTAGGVGPADDTVSTLIATRQFGTPNPGATGTDLPTECAIALSFRGDVTGLAEEGAGGLIRPKSRKRGRVFLGPFTASVAQAEAVTNRIRVSATDRDYILNAYNAYLIAAIDGPARIVNHVVYSTMNATTAKVTNAHVDDAFDTIRSRGEKSDARTSLAVVQPALVP
jgi:hypothetical protein